jgi:hypothetical protein
VVCRVDGWWKGCRALFFSMRSGFYLRCVGVWDPGWSVQGVVSWCGCNYGCVGPRG